MAYLDGSATKAVEFVPESLFGDMPTNPTMLGFGGYVTSARIKNKKVNEKIPYLKGASGTNRMNSTKTVKVGEAHSVTLGIKPTSLSLLPYVLCAASPSTYAIGDTEYPISIGQRLGTKYRELNGCMLYKYEMEFVKDKTASLTVEANVANCGAFTTTYIGSGSHAADPSGTPIRYSDVTDVTYKSSSFGDENAALNGFKWGVEYPITGIPDITSSNDSNIGSWALGQRNVYLSLDADLSDTDLAADLLADDSFEFEFTVAGKTLTFSDIAWGDSEWAADLTAEDLCGITLDASHTTLTIA
jgi:hypothetical protein